MALTDNSYTERYIELNVLFAKTVVIKLAEAAELMNEGVVAKYGEDSVNPFEPTTWKYYLNLTGQYHFSDSPMTVVSIDTLEEISFTRENLTIHSATAQAYQYGSRHYYSLLDRYPNQELLINGILTPAVMEKAIEAESGSILAYRKDLVESNEVTLLSELELWLKRQIHRWYNVQFTMSDNLYCSVFMATLSNFILPKLLNLRLARCKTSEAHSFHVRMYLASHGKLDRYLPYLTLRQSLWLYRNIAYLERNVGQTRQLSLLIDRLLTERGIPIADYTVRHTDDYNGYTPIASASLRPINDTQNFYNATSHALNELFEKELPLAEDNERYLALNQEIDKALLQTSDSGVIQTKVLSSTMTDYSNAVPVSFEEVALRQWCYLATRGMYDVMVTFKDPRTSEPYTVFAKDAFIYLWYIQLSMEGLTFETFPEYLNMRQRRHPKPTVEDLLSVTDTTKYDLRSVAEWLVSNQPVISPCFSVSNFYDQTQRLTSEAFKHWFLVSEQNDPYVRAMVENMVHRLYEDERVVFDMDTPFIEEWLSQNDLPRFEFDRAQALELTKSIYEAGTGQTIDHTKVLKNIQRAMLDLMMELSSYSIQVVQEINDEDLILINRPGIRTSDPASQHSIVRYEKADTLVMEGRTQSHQRVHVGTKIGLESRPNTCYTELCHYTEIDPTSVIEAIAGLQSLAEDKAPPAHCDIRYEGQNYGLEQQHLLPGYTSFDKLPESALIKLKSVYS